MGRLSSYGQDGDVEGSDKVIGTDGTGGDTVNFTIDSILEYYISRADWSSLPTTAPSESGRLWNDGGTLKIT